MLAALPDFDAAWRRVPDNAIPARAKPTGTYLNPALARREAMDDGFHKAISRPKPAKSRQASPAR